MKNEFDHRVLGAKYDLFSFFEEGPGLPVWHDKGLRIKNALIDYWRAVHREHGYQEIQSPIMLEKSLWDKSGHSEHFAENMYFSWVDKRDYAIKPMNCPGALLYFNQKRRSHAELPLRICELGHVHRHEQSGALHGLMRVRSFVQDDAHIFCRQDQLFDEIIGVIKLIEVIMKKCGLNDYHFELSLRGKAQDQINQKYLGDDQSWAMAEDKLESAVKSLGHKVIKRAGEAKFYGPSLDLHLKDIHGRSWQCSSVQLDFNLPQRFQVHYWDEQGVRQSPLMIHRAIYGSLERFIGIMLEHYGAALPLWLQPIGFKILSVGASVEGYAREVRDLLEREKIPCELDLGARALNEKIKHSFSQMLSGLIIVGEREQRNSEVILKLRPERGQSAIKLSELCAFIRHRLS